MFNVLAACSFHAQMKTETLTLAAEKGCLRLTELCISAGALVEAKLWVRPKFNLFGLTPRLSSIHSKTGLGGNDFV